MLLDTLAVDPAEFEARTGWQAKPEDLCKGERCVPSPGRLDLAVWQALRSELFPKGLEIVTVALDTGGAEAARPWIDAARPEHPSLIDQAHVTVVERSQPRPVEHARAAACFELGQHLWREGHHDAAVAWFREAHRLHPDNWTYKRQAWSFADPLQGPTELYDGDWLSDIRAIGAEPYYPTVSW